MLITACNNQKIPAVTLLLLPLACLCLPPSIIHWFGHSFIHDFTHSMKHREISVLSSLLLSSWMANDPKSAEIPCTEITSQHKIRLFKKWKGPRHFLWHIFSRFCLCLLPSIIHWFNTSFIHKMLHWRTMKTLYRVGYNAVYFLVWGWHMIEKMLKWVRMLNRSRSEIFVTKADLNFLSKP